jgi:hypothetical protein
LSGIEVEAIVSNCDALALYRPNRKMHSSAQLATIVVAFLIGGPAVAELAGGRITAEQPDIGRLETRIQKYDQALGVVSQLIRSPGAETDCQGVCYFPSSSRSVSWRCAPRQRCDLHCAVNPPVGGCD